MVLDKLKFEYRDEDNDTDDEMEPEKWRCIDSNCKAMILVKEGNLVIGECSEHSCSPCLQMEIVAHEFDGFKFVRLEMHTVDFLEIFGKKRPDVLYFQSNQLYILF